VLYISSRSNYCDRLYDVYIEFLLLRHTHTVKALEGKEREEGFGEKDKKEQRAARVW
jgi:hypothetical protein